MLARASNSRERLRKRVRYFVEERRFGHEELRDFVLRISTLGELALIGGALRDLVLGRKFSEFKSDLDFVASPRSLRDFDKLMHRWRADTNRFGGYRLGLQRWKIDIWPIQRTWAQTSGYCRVDTFSDLPRVTFFDWDAIVYVMGARKLFAGPNYFENVERRVIDINLEPNPNPLGNTIRALRYAYLWDAALGPNLAQFISKMLKEYDAETIVSKELKSFGFPLLHVELVNQVREELENVLEKDQVRPPPTVLRSLRRSKQLRLPLES
jgi:hypothetical protein